MTAAVTSAKAPTTTTSQPTANVLSVLRLISNQSPFSTLEHGVRRVVVIVVEPLRGAVRVGIDDVVERVPFVDQVLRPLHVGDHEREGVLDTLIAQRPPVGDVVPAQLPGVDALLQSPDLRRSF